MDTTELYNHKTESGHKKYTIPQGNGFIQDLNQTQVEHQEMACMIDFNNKSSILTFKAEVPNGKLEKYSTGDEDCARSERQEKHEKLEKLKQQIKDMLAMKQYCGDRKDMLHLYNDVRFNAVIMVVTTDSKLHLAILEMFKTEIAAGRLKLLPKSSVKKLYGISRPDVRTGNSIAHDDRWGTIGLIIKHSKSRYLVTTMHTFSQQENVFQVLPGEYYTHLNNCMVIISNTCQGYLGNYTFPIAQNPNNVWAEIEQKADIAVLLVKEDCLQLTRGLPEANVPFTTSDIYSLVTSDLDVKVTKDGAATGVTYGTLMDREYLYYYIKSDNINVRFAEHGDSGSCVFNTQSDGLERGSVMYGLIVEEIEVSTTESTYVVHDIVYTLRKLREFGINLNANHDNLS